MEAVSDIRSIQFEKDKNHLHEKRLMLIYCLPTILNLCILNINYSLLGKLLLILLSFIMINYDVTDVLICSVYYFYTIYLPFVFMSIHIP